MAGGGYTLRNQRVKHYLIQWYRFDTEINFLTEVEILKMKTLYSALKELDPEERKLLATKYRVEKRPFIKDEFVAASFNMSEKEYSKKRIEIEDKLKPLLQKGIDAHETDEGRSIAIIEKHLKKLGRTYYKMENL